MAFLQINQATHDQALVLQSALQNIPNPASECMLRNVAIRLAQQISDEVTENVRNKIFQVCKNMIMSTANGKEIKVFMGIKSALGLFNFFLMILFYLRMNEVVE